MKNSGSFHISAQNIDCGYPLEPPRFSHEITIVEFKRGITKMYRQKLRFLCCAHCLMMLYISMNFHENILKGFQVIERARNDQCQILKGNNYKTVQTRVMVLVLCTWSDDALYFYEVS